MKQRRHSQLLLGKIAVPDKKLKERPKQVKKKVSLYKAGNIAFTGITGVRLAWCVPHSAWSMLRHGLVDSVGQGLFPKQYRCRLPVLGVFWVFWRDGPSIHGIIVS